MKAKHSVSQSEQVHTSDLPETLAAALFLHRQGLALLPIRPGTKEPHHDVLKAVHGSTEWAPLAQRRASLPEVLAWFHHDPHCQLAVIAGPASGNIAILDVDKLDEAGELVDRLEALGGPVAETPRPGRHFWIRQRGPIPNGDLRLPDGRKVGEIKSGYNHAGKLAGAYVLVPPSLHPDGGAYRWMPRRGLDASIPELSAADLDALLRGAAAPDANAAVSPPRGECRKYAYSYLRHPADGPEEFVKKLQRHPAFIEGAMRVLGVGSVRIGQAFRCVLHNERRPSAALYQLEDGSVLYHDFHRRGGNEWWTLAEVFAAKVTGQLRELRGKPEHTVWILRLAVEAGVIEPAKVEAPEAPADLSPVARQVYDGFIYLLQCKWLYEPAAATAFSWRFAQGWCGGLGERQVRTAMRELLRRGLLRIVGEHPGPFGKKQALFLPGLVARAGGAKAEDKPARRTWTSKAVKQAIRAARLEDKPSTPCAECGGTLFWTIKPRAGVKLNWVCETCLPPPNERVVWTRVSVPPPS